MIERDHGGNVSEVSRFYGFDEQDIIDFSASINPLGYPSGLKEKIMEEFDSVLNYPDIESHDLVSGLSDYHGISPDCILVGNGSTEFIYLIPMVFKPGRALIVTPAFSEYEKGLSLAGADVHYFPTTQETGFDIDIAALCSRLGDGFDVLYLCNPANPAGVLTPKTDVYRIMEHAGTSGTMVIIDEAFIDFVEDESVKEAIRTFPRLMVLRSMTKFFGIPGLRVGYLLAKSSVVDMMRNHKTPWTVNSLVQKAAVQALEDGNYIENTRQYVTAERQFLRTALNAIPGMTAFDGACNFLFVSMDDRIVLNSLELRDRLVPTGILIRDCSNFQGLNDRYFRVAVKRHDQNIFLINALKDLVL
jgi:threonine-phosphate decarboxylase